jgi:hypothetical protein
MTTVKDKCCTRFAPESENVTTLPERNIRHLTHEMFQSLVNPKLTCYSRLGQPKYATDVI